MISRMSQIVKKINLFIQLDKWLPERERDNKRQVLVKINTFWGAFVVRPAFYA